VVRTRAIIVSSCLVALLSALLAGAAVGTSQVFFKTLGHPPKVKPHKVYPGGAINAPFGSHLLNWKHWGSHQTRSRGVMHYDTCRPDCASGYHTDSGGVLLNGVRRCHGQRHYTKLHFRFDHHKKYNADVRLNCHGDLKTFR